MRATNSTSTLHEAQPPNLPWRRLAHGAFNDGYLSYYYSDPLSRLPVRGVTKVGDNKADPNLETGTYGLFSTCSKSMRKSVVKKRRRFVVFFTRIKGIRCVTGFYEVHWFAETKFSLSDYCLSAERVHFVRTPLPLSKYIGDRKFRMILYAEPNLINAIIADLEKQRNETTGYIREIRRLEMINRSNTGRRYVNFGRTESFNWRDANEIFSKAERLRGQSSATSNNSSTGTWLCSACEKPSKSKSLLKVCPQCGEYATLQPI